MSLLRTLYIDIDSTIWPAEDVYAKNAIELFGSNYPMTVQYDEQFFKDTYGPGYGDIFKFNPEEIADRVLYPYAAWALNYLYGLGFELHFLSHNPAPHKMRKPVQAWLESKLQVPFKLTVFGARNCKVNFMAGEDYAWGIIEDKPSTLAKAHRHGYVTIAKEQPWNLRTIEECGILSFSSWLQIPGMVTNVLEKGQYLALDTAT